MKVSILFFHTKLACQERTLLRTGLFSWITNKSLCGLLLIALAQGESVAQSGPEEVVFPGGGGQFARFLVEASA